MTGLPDSRERALQRLGELGRQALEGGGEARLRAQHERGKLSARERLELLLDEGSFVELDRFVTHRSSDFGLADRKVLGDGVVTGYGAIHGRVVYVFSQDFTVFGGSVSEAHAEKIVKIQDLALKTGAPLIGLNDSGGARIQEGVVSLGGYADIFLRNTLASGVIPQISVILGPCAGGAVYSPAITDLVYMVRGTSFMFVTGPDVVKTVTHQDIDMEGLGGADVHAGASGVAHFAHDSEAESLASVRQVFRYLPSNNAELPPEGSGADPHDRRSERLADIVPHSPNRPYDILEVIREVADDGDFYESTPASPATWSPDSPTWAAARWASWPTSPPFSPGCSTSTAPTRGRASCGSATPSTSPWSSSRTCPDSCRG